MHIENQPQANEIIGNKEISFEPNFAYRTVDGNFPIVEPETTQITPADVEAGVRGKQDKINRVYSRLLKGLSYQLSHPDTDTGDARRAVLLHLRQGRPVFMSVDSELISKNFRSAGELFKGATPGLVLFPENSSSINTISALHFENGEVFRLLQANISEDPEDFQNRLNEICPETRIRASHGNDCVIAMKYMSDSSRPEHFTQAQLDDWLERGRKSGLIYGFDVSEKEEKLDNVVMANGKLYWIDGNIMNARIAKNEEELEKFISHQRNLLKRFVKE